MAAMFFEDAADDREPEPRALFTRGHVRLEQARAVLFGKSYAVVDDIDDDVFAVALGADDDAAAAEFGGGHRPDRFGRVLDDVGERLPDHPPAQTRPPSSPPPFPPPFHTP